MDVLQALAIIIEYCTNALFVLLLICVVFDFIPNIVTSIKKNKGKIISKTRTERIKKENPRSYILNIIVGTAFIGSSVILLFFFWFMYYINLHVSWHHILILLWGTLLINMLCSSGFIFLIDTIRILLLHCNYKSLRFKAIFICVCNVLFFVFSFEMWLLHAQIGISYRICGINIIITLISLVQLLKEYVNASENISFRLRIRLSFYFLIMIIMSLSNYLIFSQYHSFSHFRGIYNPLDSLYFVTSVFLGTGYALSSPVSEAIFVNDSREITLMITFCSVFFIASFISLFLGDITNMEEDKNDS